LPLIDVLVEKVEVTFCDTCPTNVTVTMIHSCLPVFLANYGLVLIITSETELEISGHVVQRFWSKKRFEKRATRCTQVT